MAQYLANDKPVELLEHRSIAALTIEIVQGKNVLDLISDDEFLTSWEDLYSKCSWATVFQSPAFVTTWYAHYNKSYHPVIIKGTQNEQLIGLLTLAVNKKDKITGAGANQAEYQVWLARESLSEDFIIEALVELRKLFPFQEINFKYIPSGTKLNWVEKHSYFSKLCFIRKVKQPLMIIDHENITRELKKKNRREKLNRLKRLGALKFEKITVTADFLEIIEELIHQSDFRKGAMYNKCAFQKDPKRKNFLVELFRKGLLHTTVLKIDENIIASNVSVAANNWLHLQGINTHSPFHSKHSPGILHFLMLGKLMAEEGGQVFDLTPGSDPYKDSLATDYSEATELKIYSSKTRIPSQIKYKSSKLLKRVIYSSGVSQATINQYRFQIALLKEKANLIKYKSLRHVLSEVILRFTSKNNLNIFKLNQTNTSSTQHNCLIKVHKDSLQDILLYDPNDTLKTKWEFLMSAMKRFEQGQHCYIWSENDRLVGIAWLMSAKATDFPQINTWELPDNTPILYDFEGFGISMDKLVCFVKAVNEMVTAENTDNPLILSNNNKLNIALKNL